MTTPNHAAGLALTLRTARHAKGWTQQMLADFATVGVHTVRRMESRGQIPKVNTLMKVARALGLVVTISFTQKEGA